MIIAFQIILMFSVVICLIGVIAEEENHKQAVLAIVTIFTIIILYQTFSL